MAINLFMYNFIVYYIVQGLSDTVPEIAYKIAFTSTEWDLEPLNPMLETDKITKFLILSGQPLNVSVYHDDTHNNVNTITIRNLFSGDPIRTGPLKCQNYGSKKCYVQVNSVTRNIAGEWEITYVRPSSNPTVSKIIETHIRPKVASQVELNSTIMTTQTANYRIKEFDAFTCLIYNDYEYINLQCLKSSDSISSLFWNTTGSNPSTYQNEKSSYSNYINIENNTGHLDCIEKYNGYPDTNVVRVFLIYNGSGLSTSNENVYNLKPTSYKDLAGCERYVNCLYDPEVKKHKEKYCVTHEAKKTSGLPYAWIIAAVVCAVIILLISAFVIKKSRFSKGKKSSREDLVSYSNQPNDSINSRQTSSNVHENMYCNIDASLHTSLPRQVNNNQVEEDGTEEFMTDNLLYNKPIDIYAEVNRSTVEQQIDKENDMLYSYVYSDSFAIKPVPSVINCNVNDTKNHHHHDIPKFFKDNKTVNSTTEYENIKSMSNTSENHYMNMKGDHKAMYSKMRVNNTIDLGRTYVNKNVYENTGMGESSSI